MVECESLLDTGSSEFLMNMGFFRRHFPETPTEKTETTLRYASGPVKTKVTRVARMSFQAAGDQRPLTFTERFFLIPELAFDVYLGEGFLRDARVICFSPGAVYMSQRGDLGKTCLAKWLGSFDEIKRSPIKFVRRPPQASNVTCTHSNTEKPSQVPNEPSLDKENDESNGMLKSDQLLTLYSSNIPPLGLAPSVVEPGENEERKMEDAERSRQNWGRGSSLEGSNDSECGSRIHNPHNTIPPFQSICREDFDKMVSPYHIEEEERARMWWQYHKEGRTQIPVTNYVERVAETNGLSEVVECYYEDLASLLEVLDIAHLPEGPLNILKEFLVDNMDVFSRSETDVGYYSGYEARVSLRRDIKDINVKFNPFPAAIRPKVRSILRRYHDLGIISFAGEDIKDPIVSNLVVVKKSNNQIRIAFDARCVNYLKAKGKCYHRSLAQTMRDIDLNSRFFSTLDLSSAYFCIPLHRDSRRYFCFRDADNKLCFLIGVFRGTWNQINTYREFWSKFSP